MTTLTHALATVAALFVSATCVVAAVGPAHAATVAVTAPR